MSVFERIVITKVNIDDTDLLVANIINSELKDGHTEYIIQVERSERRWLVERRYNEFLALDSALKESSLELPLPPKRYIGNLDRSFIFQRQAALQIYLDEILKNPILSASFPVKAFLDPTNYKACKDDSPVNELQMVICQESELKNFKLLPQLGWRFRKKSYLVSFRGSTKNDLLLQWVPFGPDKTLVDEEIQIILKSFTSLQHVNIAKLERGGMVGGGGWTLQDLKRRGSLLDSLAQVRDPSNTSCLKKYANYNLRNPLPSAEVIEISSQILQGLAFLHHKGIPYGHLHLGNVLLDGNLIRLSGIENALFGLPSFYRHFFINLKLIDSMQAMDVFAFGLSIYEMLFTKSFNMVTKEISGDCPSALRSVLDSILSLRAMKNGLPSVKDLLNLQIFRRPPPNPLPYFKQTQKSRADMETIGNKILERVKLDYSKVREQKKAKAREKLLTERNAVPSFGHLGN